MSDIPRDALRVNLGPYVYGQGDPCEPITDEEFDRLALERVLQLPSVAPVALEWMQQNPTKALRALLTDKCETCHGRGTLPPTKDEQRYGASGDDFHTCPDCGGRGWLPKDGVYIEWNCDAPSYAKEYGGCNPGDDFYPHRHTLCRYQVEFPADWLEAEHEQ